MQPITSTIDDVLDGMLLQHTPPNILLAEDDEAMRALIAATLSGSGYDILQARSGTELIRSVHRIGTFMLPLDLVITDINMPGFSGIEVLEYLRYAGWDVPVIVITAFCDDRTRVEATKLDARAVLTKPFDLDELVSAVAGITPPRRQPTTRAAALVDCAGPQFGAACAPHDDAIRTRAARSAFAQPTRPAMAHPGLASTSSTPPDGGWPARAPQAGPAGDSTQSGR